MHTFLSVLHLHNSSGPGCFHVSLVHLVLSRGGEREVPSWRKGRGQGQECRMGGKGKGKGKGKAALSVSIAFLFSPS